MKIIIDVAKKLQITQQDVFTLCCALLADLGDPKDLWRYYQKTNSIPRRMTDILIDTMTEKPNALAHIKHGRNCGAGCPVSRRTGPCNHSG